WLIASFWSGRPAVILVLGALAITALALLERIGVIKLLGPVFWYDTIRSARRGRYFLVRWLYAISLLLLLLWVHSMWSLDQRFGNNSESNPYKALAKLAEEYFFAFAIVQFVAVVLLTPAYVGGAIAEEKERKTLEFLLATDLQNSEIIFGKLAARVGNLALFLLTGLPVLSLMQFFGGIDPGFLLVTFAVTAVTAASLAGLAILNSTMRRRARDAIVLTYFAVFGYAALTGLSVFLKFTLMHFNRVYTIIPAFSWTLAGHPIDFGGLDTTDLFDAFNVGNPIFGIVNVAQAFGARTIGYEEVMLDELRKYATWHGIVTAVCITWAVLRLRGVALTQGGTAKRVKRGRRIVNRPPVGDRPMMWKEIRVEGNPRFGWFGYAFLMFLVAASFVPVGVIFYNFAFNQQNEWIGLYGRSLDEFRQAVNAWLRITNGFIGSLMLLAVAVRGAGAVSSERDRDTLTGLLTTPITTGEIVWAKFWGGMLSVRALFLWLGAIWALALLCGAVQIAALPLNVILWAAPAAFFAVMGIWYSTVCKTTLRATTWSLVTALLAGGAHWVCMGMCCFLPLSLVARGGPGTDFKWVFFFELGLTPPFIFGWLPFLEVKDLDLDREGLMPGFALVGAVLWCVAAAVVGHFTHERFQEVTHRNQWERPLPPRRAKEDEVPVVRAAEE
ncbi:MAG TPA: ABC transporter permease subunit, partial [Gemmataceae bacterium]|nr:ABC transporter permease subunit [Gemmataceae bacterium]